VRPALAVAEALAVSVAVLLILLVGFCILFVFPKLRRPGRNAYISPDAPHGPVDQLRTPELLESKAPTGVIPR
jgi:hypothetical protein